MTTKNVIEFLEGYNPTDLKEKGILRGNTNELNNNSVEPLIKLMKDAGATRLENPESSWFLDVYDCFNNPEVGNIGEGRISKLKNIEKPGALGAIFTGQNRIINPHYKRD